MSPLVLVPKIWQVILSTRHCPILSFSGLSRTSAAAAEPTRADAKKQHWAQPVRQDRGACCLRSLNFRVCTLGVIHVLCNFLRSMVHILIFLLFSWLHVTVDNARKALLTSQHCRQDGSHRERLAYFLPQSDNTSPFTWNCLNLRGGSHLQKSKKNGGSCSSDLRVELSILPPFSRRRCPVMSLWSTQCQTHTTVHQFLFFLGFIVSLILYLYWPLRFRRVCNSGPLYDLLELLSWQYLMLSGC
jgi:hypothetical protein